EETADGPVVHTLSGERLPAGIVVSAMHPHLTVRAVQSNNPDWQPLREKARRVPPAGSAFKIVLALGDMPRYSAAKNDEEACALATAQLRVAPTLDYLEACHADLSQGRMPERPLIWGLCHSMSTPEMAPDKKHILSLNLGGAPHRGGQKPAIIDKDKVVRDVIRIMSEWIPNIDNIVEASTCIGAATFEN